MRKINKKQYLCLSIIHSFENNNKKTKTRLIKIGIKLYIKNIYTKKLKKFLTFGKSSTIMGLNF